MRGNRKNISFQQAEMTGDRLSPSPVGPREGRKGRASVITPEKKGKELARPPETQKSACSNCALLNTRDKRCPIDYIPIRFDIVVWVDECGARKPRK